MQCLTWRKKIMRKRWRKYHGNAIHFTTSEGHVIMSSALLRKHRCSIFVFAVLFWIRLQQEVAHVVWQWVTDTYIELHFQLSCVKQYNKHVRITENTNYCTTIWFNFSDQMSICAFSYEMYTFWLILESKLIYTLRNGLQKKPSFITATAKLYLIACFADLRLKT